MLVEYCFIRLEGSIEKIIANPIPRTEAPRDWIEELDLGPRDFSIYQLFF